MIYTKNQRVKANTNLTLMSDRYYKGYEVLTFKGPLIREYLDSLIATIHNALNEYPRGFAIRFDLRFPHNWDFTKNNNPELKRFIASLKAKIKHDRSRSDQLYARVHDTTVRCVWANEYGQEGKPHYHFLILLNRDAYSTLGHFDSDLENMSSRIRGAWASALAITWEQSAGLVEFPKNSTYRINNTEGDPATAELVMRASYLCKAATKQYGDRRHSFGYSRD
tara:strand:- start:1712 stop:2380 length:669 start_codon:yes stop_codon:yes gene_type:complete